MRSTSTLFTVGTLLSRAQDAGTPVRVLVEGVWVAGTPVESDGHGVILDGPSGQFLVRTNAITVVAYDHATEDGSGEDVAAYDTGHAGDRVTGTTDDRVAWEQPAARHDERVPDLVRA
jgi:hypothetical protein